MPSLGAGTYIVTVSAPGFKQSVAQDVKLDAGVPGYRQCKAGSGRRHRIGRRAGRRRGSADSDGQHRDHAEVRQISNLPLHTRNAMDFSSFAAGTNTTDTAAQLHLQRPPPERMNVTIDGLNTKITLTRPDDGFYSYVSSRLDAIEEVTISTATPGAESSGQGAIQIKYVTRSRAATISTAASTSTIATLRSIPITGSITATRRITWRPQETLRRP